MSTSTGSQSTISGARHGRHEDKGQGLAAWLAAVRAAIFGTVIVISRGAVDTSARTACFFAAVEVFQLASFPLSLVNDAPGLRPLFLASDYLTTGAFDRFISSYGFTTILVVVTSIVASFLVLTATVSYRFAARLPQGRGVLRTVAALASLSTSILFIPFAKVLMNAFTCNGMDGLETGRWMGTDLTCGSAGHVVLAIVMGIILALFTGLSLFLAATFVNTSPVIGSWSARIHSRVDVGVILMKLLLSFVWSLSAELSGEFAAPAVTIPAATLVTIANLLWATAVWWFAPFIRMRMNAIAFAEAAVVAWLGLAALAHRLFPDHLDPSLMVLLGGPAAALAAYMTFMNHVSSMSTIPRRQAEQNSTSLELWARLKLRHLLLEPNLRSFLQSRRSRGTNTHAGDECLYEAICDWKQALSSDHGDSDDGADHATLQHRGHRRNADHSVADGSRGGRSDDISGQQSDFDALSEARPADDAGDEAQLLLAQQSPSERARITSALAALQEAERAYGLLADNFPTSELALLAASSFFAAYSPFQYRELLILHKAAQLNSSLDVQYRAFRRVRQLQLQGAGDGGDSSAAVSSTLLDRVLVEQNVGEIHRLERDTYRTTTKLWTALAGNVVDFGPVVTYSRRLDKSFSRLGTLYRDVLRASPNSTAVLRGYAAFLRDQRHDEDAGQEYDNKADRLEEAHSRRLGRAVKHIVYGASSRIRLDGSDESSAVVVISGAPGNVGEVLQASMGACRLLNYRSSQQLVGANVKELVPEPIRSRHDRYLRRFAMRHTSSVVNHTRTLFVMTLSGTVLPCYVQVQESPPDPVTAAPRFTGVLEPISTTEQHLIFAPAEQGSRIHCGTAASLDLIGLTPDAIKANDDESVSAATYFPTLLADTGTMYLMVEQERMQLLSGALLEEQQQQQQQQLQKEGAAVANGAAPLPSPSGSTLSGTSSFFSTRSAAGSSAVMRDRLISVANVAMAIEEQRGKQARIPGTNAQVVSASSDRVVLCLGPIRTKLSQSCLIPVLARNSAGSTSLDVVVGGLQPVQGDRSFVVLRWTHIDELLRRASRQSRAKLARAISHGGSMTSQARGGAASSVSTGAGDPAGRRSPAQTSLGASPDDAESHGPTDRSDDAGSLGSLATDSDEERADAEPNNGSDDEGAGTDDKPANPGALAHTPARVDAAAAATGVTTGTQGALSISQVIQRPAAAPGPLAARQGRGSMVHFEADQGTESRLRVLRELSTNPPPAVVVKGRVRGDDGEDRSSQPSSHTSATMHSQHLVEIFARQRTMKDRDVWRVQLTLLTIALLVMGVGAANLFWVRWSGEQLNGVVHGLERSGQRMVMAQRCVNKVYEIVGAQAGLHGEIFDSVEQGSAELRALAGELQDLHEDIVRAGDRYGSKAQEFEHFTPLLVNELASGVVREFLRNNANVTLLRSGALDGLIEEAPCHNFTQCKPLELAFIGEGSTEFWVEQSNVIRFNQMDPQWTFTNETRQVYLAPSEDPDILTQQQAFLRREVPAIAESVMMPMTHFGEYFAIMLARVAAAEQDFGYQDSDVHNVLANDRTFYRAANATLQTRATQVAQLLPNLRLQLQVTGIASFASIVLLQVWAVSVLVTRLSSRVRGVVRLLLLIPRRTCKQVASRANSRWMRLTEQEAGIEQVAGTDEPTPADAKRRFLRPDEPPTEGQDADAADDSSPEQTLAGGADGGKAGVVRTDTVDSDALDDRLIQAGMSARQRVPRPLQRQQQLRGGSSHQGDRKVMSLEELDQRERAQQGPAADLHLQQWNPSKRVVLRPHKDSSRFVLRQNLRMALPVIPVILWLTVLFASQMAQQSTLEGLVNQVVLSNAMSQSMIQIRRDVLESVMTLDPDLRRAAQLRMRSQSAEITHLASVGLFGGELNLAATNFIIAAPSIDPSTRAFGIFMDDGCIGSDFPAECTSVSGAAMSEGAYSATLKLIALVRKMEAELPTADEDPHVPLVYGYSSDVWRLLVEMWHLVDPHLRNSYQRMTQLLIGQLEDTLQVRWERSVWYTAVFALLYIVLLIVSLVWAGKLAEPLHAMRAMMTRLPKSARQRVPPLLQAIRDMATEANGEVVNVKFDSRSTHLVKSGAACCRARPGGGRGGAKVTPQDGGAHRRTAADHEGLRSQHRHERRDGPGEVVEGRGTGHGGQ